MISPKRRINWKRLQPSSLRHAMELCKEHAKLNKNMSVERIAAQMGLADHWALYKWLESGRMPVCLMPAYESACGINFMTRWLAATGNKLLVDMPKGQEVNEQELVDMSTDFSKAVQLLKNFYAAPGVVPTEEVLEALRSHMQQVAAHHANVTAYQNPELDF